MKAIILSVGIAAFLAMSAGSTEAPAGAAPKTIKLTKKATVSLTFHFPAGTAVPVVPNSQCDNFGKVLTSNPKYRWCATKDGGVALTPV